MPKIKSKSRPSKNSKKQTKETSTLSLKEQLAQKRKAAQARKEFISLLTTAIFGGVFVGILLFSVAGIKAAVPGVLGILIMSLSYKYPRQALYAFIIYVPIGGTITYYLGNSPVLQLAKDAFYIPALIGLWQTCRKQGLPIIIPQGIKIPLYIVLSFSLLTLLFVNGGQQFNPPSVGLLEKAPQEIPIGMGILGLKVFLGYVPLLACAYYLIRDKRDFLFVSRLQIVRDKRDFLFVSRLQIVLTLFCCVLGFIQYFLLLTGVCEGTRGLEGDALFRATLEARCYFGGALVYSPDEGVIRLPGTFVAPWQWAWFLIASTFFTFATAFTDPSIVWHLCHRLHRPFHSLAASRFKFFSNSLYQCCNFWTENCLSFSTNLLRSFAIAHRSTWQPETIYPHRHRTCHNSGNCDGE